ncbi:MAG: division plane positioning ATPase MipZ [Alphaproteobacteria bacterium]
MTGRVLVAATGKGGAGKSTVIACLASHWSRRNRSVALVDADPNRTLSRWHAKGGALSRLTLRAETDEHAIIPLISDLAASHDLVLVDCAGFGNQAMVFAIGAADLVLIPVMTDEANVFEAVRTRKLVESAGRLTRRSIAARTLMTRVKRATVSTHTQDQLVALQAEPLASRMIDRAIYQEASYHGASPIDLDPASAAAEDIASLAGELESLDWWALRPAETPTWQAQEHIA